jgi:DMSO reductase family type II enzyme heme b subunit
MLVQRVKASAKDLLDPGSDVWRRAKTQQLALSPTPLDMQPTEYVRVSWRGRPYGTLASIRASSVHNGEAIFFRLVWDDDTADERLADINHFLDAAAVLFPLSWDAPLLGMGTKGKPVNAWFWRADWERPQNVAAEGMGTTQRRDDRALVSQAVHARRRWQVVIGRQFARRGAPPGTVALKPGMTWRVAFAVWQGSNQERAGIKAYTPDWQEIQIEA